MTDAPLAGSLWVLFCFVDQFAQFAVVWSFWMAPMARMIMVMNARSSHGRQGWGATSAAERLADDKHSAPDTRSRIAYSFLVPFDYRPAVWGRGSTL